ncbi:Trehalose synthase/amylase TreS [Streptomyces sp. MH192]|nr:Trehalose synthase/amylase TreS [Streptomyces sp. MH192]MCF0101540.1 Trehalose synthase/amylase TreS [Streptomyces sp. MH191]
MRFPAIGELPYLLTLAGHGFYWFRLRREAAPATKVSLIASA